MSGWGVKGSPRAGSRDTVAVRVVNDHRDLPPSIETAARRAARMSVRDLLDYAETNLSGIGRCLNDYSHEHGQGDALREAEVAAGALYAVLAEAARREPIPPPAEPSVDTLRRMGTAR